MCVALFLLAVFAVSAGEEPRKCEDCVPEKCVPPAGECRAGLVRDLCGCCFVCGQGEGEPCDSDVLPIPYRGRGDGPCGEALECRPRSDLAHGDPPGTQCVCRKEEALCGSDGQTYENECQLTEARYKLRNGLQAVHRGPCRSVPKIVSPPEDVSNTTGGNVALSCEATGWPVPAIEWRVDRGDSNTEPLPTDDSNIAVQSRGGPSKYEITSWLQLLRIQPSDDAIYWCIAKNEEGESSAAARIILLDSKTLNPLKMEKNNDL